MEAQVWDDDRTQCLGMLMDGRAQPTGIRKRGGDATLLMVFNAHHDIVKFTLPPCFEGRGWVRLLDTNDPDLPSAEFKIGAVYDVTGRSLLLFERAPEKNA
jgi:glycogen operon protein